MLARRRRPCDGGCGLTRGGARQMTAKHVKIVILPVFRRYWLYHAWETSPSSLAPASALNWRKGQNLEEKLTLLSSQISQQVGGRSACIGELSAWPESVVRQALTRSTWLCAQLYSRLMTQWRGLQSAKEGTFKHWLHKCVLPPLSVFPHCLAYPACVGWQVSARAALMIVHMRCITSVCG